MHFYRGGTRSPEAVADLDSRAGGSEFMASAGPEPVMGVWGLCPQWGPGAKPMVRGSKGLRPLKLTRF